MYIAYTDVYRAKTGGDTGAIVSGSVGMDQKRVDWRMYGPNLEGLISL